MSVDEDLARALTLYQRGDRAAAETACRAALEAAPTHARGLHLLAALRHAAGDVHGAIALLRQAIAAEPDYAEAEFALGDALTAAGEALTAVDHYRRAAAMRPSHPEPHLRLGAALLNQGDLVGAEAALRRVLALRPEDAVAATDLATALLRQHRIADAVRYARRAVALAPKLAAAHARLGLALRAEGSGDMRAAEDSFRTALTLEPADRETAVALADLLQHQNRLIEAADVCESIITRAPDFAEAHTVLAGVLVAMGEVERGIAAAREAIRLRPDDARLRRQLLLYYELSEEVGAVEILAGACDWQERFAAPLIAAATPHQARAAADRLRIAYVGGGLLRRSPLVNVMLPILQHHDRQQFDIICYSDLPESQEDSFSRQFQAIADWRRSEGLTDAELADAIRRDGVDIAVDCTQFFPGSRMLAFARRPAPVQIAFPLNATVGNRAIDYVIADEYVTPPGFERFFAETVLRIPLTHCYQPLEPAPPPATSPPVIKNRRITFGSFNWLSKISPGTMTAWGQILAAVPGSRLAIKGRALLNDTVAERVLGRLAAHGVDIARVEIWPWANTFAEHMAAFNEIDIALDTFPYHGVTTTCDALWMGVPVVVLVGEKVLGRYGLGLLKTVGFDEGITHDRKAYVAAACRLAADTARLVELRQSLPQRFRQSLVCDGAATARALEGAYREAWRRWRAAH